MGVTCCQGITLYVRYISSLGPYTRIHVLGTLHKVPSFRSLSKSFPVLGGYLILLVIASCGVTKKRKVMLKT